VDLELREGKQEREEPPILHLVPLGAAKLAGAEVCDELLTDKATPIIVVTIESMANHGGADMRIETFATLLFNQWQIGHESIGEEYWNTGILLLVSKGDRKARIELGGG
jgi:uncharacterized protein